MKALNFHKLFNLSLRQYTLPIEYRILEPPLAAVRDIAKILKIYHWEIGVYE